MANEPIEPSLDADGIPDLEAPAPGKAETGDAQEGVMPPGEKFHGATKFGTTAQEQEEGESLDSKLARERPDPANEVEP